MALFVGSNKYVITDSNCLMYAEKVEGCFDATIVYHSNPGFVGVKYGVNSENVTVVSLDDFARKNSLSDSDINAIKSRIPVCDDGLKYFNIFDKSKMYYWSDEIELVNQAENLLELYGYNPSSDALSTIILTVNESKGWIDELMSHHPNYINGKHYIAMKRKFHRDYNRDDIAEFFRWFVEPLKTAFIEKHGIAESEISEISLNTAVSEFKNYKTIVETINKLKDSARALIDEKKYDDFCNKMYYYKNIIIKYNSYYEVSEGKWLYVDDSNMYSKLLNLVGTLTRENQILRDETVDKINELFPSKTKFANKGQKTTRVVGKIAKEFGIDKISDIQTISWLDDSGLFHQKEKDMGWNYQYAKYCDAINPTEDEHWIVISVNPIDYWTMSFGHKWASCHTIDKNNVRGSDNTYSGCYSSGTESYMLDKSTIIVYLVDGKYSGTDFEKQDKLKRCNFHLGENKIVQGRLYPDGRDKGDFTTADEMRAIVQEVFAECAGVENKWIKKRGTEACYDAIIEDTDKTNYPDYFHYNDCNVSVLKEGKDNLKKIIVGHAPICPCCGEEHYEEDNICCENCQKGGLVCECCGSVIDENDFVWYDEYGNPYCEDCVTYCEYHNDYEVNENENFTYVEFIGYVCEDALESGDYFFDEYVGLWYEIDYDTITTYDGFMFLNEEHASKYGYYYDEETREWRI